MTPEDIAQMKAQLNRIERCLTGDNEMGQRGLVETCRDHSHRIGLIERTGIYIGGAGGMIVILWTLWTQWPRK